MRDLSEIDRYPVLLLDMNSTFMFGGARFGPDDDYAATYLALGGSLPAAVVQAVIQDCFDRLLVQYYDPAYHDCFPSITGALCLAGSDVYIGDADLELLAKTFARHELGCIPDVYAGAVRSLARRHRLALVADLWSTPEPWREALAAAGLMGAFEVLVFSSDHGCVKPSPTLFQVALERMQVRPEDCVMVGDSARRDVGGARAAGIAAVWIGIGPPPTGADWVVNDLRDLLRGHEGEQTTTC